MNLLVFKVNKLGDNLVFLAVTQQLRRMWPQGEFTLFTTPVAAPLYGGPCAPTKLVVVERSDFNGSWREPAQLWRHWQSVRAANAEACLVSFDQGSIAHLLARFSGAPIRVGSANLNIRAPNGLTHRLPYVEGTPIAEWNWTMGQRLAEALGRKDWPEQPIAPDLSHLVTPQPKARPRIVIHAGASLPYRQWFPERFAELANRLSADFDVIWVARPETTGVAISPAIRSITGSTLAEMASWLQGADLYIGNNSGVLHMASALGCRGVIVSGPSHYQWDPTWFRERFLVLRAPGLACLPCETPGFAPEKCLNLEHPMACMRHWEVDEVERRCREWIRPAL